jgi:hypothetical protein
MFAFIVKRLGFIKYIPFVAAAFDGMLRVHLLVTNRALMHTLDAVEKEVMSWKGVNIIVHKYGGTQFNIGRKEIGHIHGNGLMDVHFTKKQKQALLREGKAVEHHVLKGSGWISYYIRSEDDRQGAIGLLRMAYEEKISG